MELRPATALHAVHRPHHLRSTAELAELADLLAGVVRGEALVIARVPVLRRDHHVKSLHQLARDRHRLVAVRDGERATGQEVVLQIDENERAHHHDCTIRPREDAGVRHPAARTRLHARVPARLSQRWQAHRRLQDGSRLQGTRDLPRGALSRAGVRRERPALQGPAGVQEGGCVPAGADTQLPRPELEADVPRRSRRRLRRIDGLPAVRALRVRSHDRPTARWLLHRDRRQDVCGLDALHVARGVHARGRPMRAGLDRLQRHFMARPVRTARIWVPRGIRERSTTRSSCAGSTSRTIRAIRVS